MLNYSAGSTVTLTSASPTAISGSFWFVDSGSLSWYYDSSTSLPQVNEGLSV
jgi:hypothetical protein